VPVSVFTIADSTLPIMSTAPAWPSTSTFERAGIVTMISMRFFSPRGRTSIWNVPPFDSTFTSSGATSIPVDRASIVTFFCCSSDATTLTRPSRFLTISETFSGASSSDLNPWANAERHNPVNRNKSWARRWNDIADRSCPPERRWSSAATDYTDYLRIGSETCASVSVSRFIGYHVSTVAQSEPTRDPRLYIHNLVKRDPLTGLAEDVRKGLTAQPKRFLPKYFYDELGSQLFEAICLLPEYYLTRAENEILEKYSDQIVSAVEGHKTLVEMGSGSASKTRLIIEALLRGQQGLLFMPVDISATALESSSRILLQSYPRLTIEAYAADYFAGLAELGKKPRTRTLA